MKIESYGGGYVSLGVLLLAAVVSLAKAKQFNFKMPDDSDPSILLEADFEIDIKAFENNMVVAAYVGGSRDHSNLEIFGLSGKRSILELMFPNEGISWGLYFDEKSLHDISVDRVVKFTPVTIFPPFPTLNYELTFEDKGNTDYHSALKSFQCDHTITRTYSPKHPLKGLVNFVVTVTISNFRVQAYHVKDGKFSPSTHCPSDQEFVPTPPHPHVITTQPAIPFPGEGGIPVNTFIVNNTIANNTVKCISMVGRISFDIAYYVFDGQYQTSRRKVKIGVPKKVSTYGACQLDYGTQKLSISFLGNWVVEFLFSINVGYSLPSESGDYQSKLDYSIKSVSLKYNIDDNERFPQAFKSEGSNFTISLTEHESLPRKKASSGFFSCDAEKRYEMSKEVTLVLSDLKFKAFINDQDTNFYGIPNTCEEDMVEIGASTLVVVVGCLIITFSFVIFIAFLALISVKCRTKRKRRKYTAI